MKILVLILAISLLQACTNKEKLIEKCADDPELSNLKRLVDNWTNKKIKVEKNIKEYRVVPTTLAYSNETFYIIEEIERGIFGGLQLFPDGSEENKDGSLTLKDGSIITVSEFLEKTMKERNSKLADFESLSLKEKLQERKYENRFKKCVEQHNSDKITFNAKWK